MAIAISSIVARVIERNASEVIFDFTGPASYTTNGELLTAAQQAQLFPALGAGQALDFTKATMHEGEKANNGKWARLDKANNKIILMTAASAEESAATNLSAQTYRMRIIYGIRTS